MTINGQERIWNLASAISAIAVFGLAIGLSAPLLSLILESRGTPVALTGLNTASTFVGIILGPLVTRPLIARFGIRRLIMICFALDAALFLSLKIFDDLLLWFVLRFTLGVVGSSIFTATEAWISLLADDRRRGRIIAVYATSLSLGMAVGPLILAFTGIAGWAPFLTNAVVIVLAATPLLFVKDTTRGWARESETQLAAIVAKAPLLILTVTLFGVFEGGALALLPIWGIRSGLNSAMSAATVTAIYLGAILMQMPIGWLSDIVPRRMVLRLCAIAGFAGAGLVPVISGNTPILFIVLLLWGGVVTGLYPVALSIAGDRFRGTEMVTANAALIMSYGIGSCAGPILGGIAMEAWDPNGLLVLFCVLFSLFLLAILRAGQQV